jgi:acyl-CoA thioester hydrolase
MTETAPALRCFDHRVRVYWEDTDAGGVVFYANYLKYFERARTEWLRALGFSQQRLREDTGAIFIVTDTTLSYRQPARLDDELRVSVEPRELRGASMRIAQRAWRVSGEAELLLAEGEIRIGCVDHLSFRPRRIPAAILEAALAPAP